MELMILPPNRNTDGITPKYQTPPGLAEIHENKDYREIRYIKQS